MTEKRYCDISGVELAPDHRDEEIKNLRAKLECAVEALEIISEHASEWSGSPITKMANEALDSIHGGPGRPSHPPDTSPLIEAVKLTIARADDYGDSYITQPIREAMQSEKESNK